jgi:Tol biopolymer transport system component
MTARRPLLATAMLVAVGLTAMLANAPALGAFPGSNGRIAYDQLSRADGHNDIFTVLPGGGAKLRLTTTGDAFDPAWAPGGGRIVFTRTNPNTFNSDLWVMRADGSAKTQLTSGAAIDEDASWAPDSRRIVFSSNRSGSRQLHVFDTVTKTMKRITSRGTTDAFAFAPNWSPSGTLIAFSRSSSTAIDLYTVRPDATGLRRLTPTATLDEDAPNWAPGGGRLTYTRHLRSDGLGCSHAVFTINSDGTGARKIFDTVCEDWESAWSPNGRRIVLHSDGPRNASGAHPQSGIWTVNPDGTARAFLGTTVDGYFPDWQPIP